MKRDPRFQPLSREHHHALVLARRAMRGALTVDEVRRAYDDELADRMLREHDDLGAALAREDLTSFGRLLAEHVRFEERELFPACEAILAAA